MITDKFVLNCPMISPNWTLGSLLYHGAYYKTRCSVYSIGWLVSRSLSGMQLKMKPYSRNSLVFVTFALAVVICTGQIPKYFPNELCGCSTTWRPACGNNNITYQNYCVLRCIRIRYIPTLDHQYAGECGSPQNITKYTSSWKELEPDPPATYNIPLDQLTNETMNTANDSIRTIQPPSTSG